MPEDETQGRGYTGKVAASLFLHKRDLIRRIKDYG